MRVLWLCNICLPSVAKKINYPIHSKEGWLTGLSNRLLSGDYDITLGVCFPTDQGEQRKWDVTTDFCFKNQKRERTIKAYSFCEDMRAPEQYEDAVRVRMQEIIADFKPDIVHIFGTEYAHGLAMAKAFNNPNRLLVGIQGICAECAKVYTQGIPERIVNRRTLRDKLRKDSIKEQKAKFYVRAQNEDELLKLTGNVTGRTTYDFGFTKRCAPQAHYYHMNETLRNCFYEGEWKQAEATQYEILVSQADYTIKGFHSLIAELPAIVEAYPDVTVCVGGNSIIGEGNLKKRVLISSYGKHLRELMRKYGVMNRIRFLGMLSAEEMKKAYLSANVFVCCSLTENSPNCIGEAMILGVPIVAAKVGGIPDLITDEEGYLYQPKEPGALTAAVIQAFSENGGLAQTTRITRAKEHAVITHKGDVNIHRLTEIYKDIAESSN